MGKLCLESRHVSMGLSWLDSGSEFTINTYYLMGVRQPLRTTLLSPGQVGQGYRDPDHLVTLSLQDLLAKCKMII